MTMVQKLAINTTKIALITSLRIARHSPFASEAPVKLLRVGQLVIPGKQSATRNPGFSNSSGFRLGQNDDQATFAGTSSDRVI
jgi:hypothetical protein